MPSPWDLGWYQCKCYWGCTHAIAAATTECSHDCERGVQEKELKYDEGRIDHWAVAALGDIYDAS